ncbi:unnamed protein product, partial [marine sediment metagenome]
TGVSGTVREAVANYKEGKYKAVSQPDAASHSGMGRN